ncbi:MAG: efflux RND transporter periplasmic adaptor subunit [Deltaproteobacteria bacterium]|nr:efflux RND transporter periplasmic adaptor subunit [Deltaproteobacteria bacterium]
MARLASWLALALMACGPAEPEAAAEQSAATDPEAMCAEHGVLEAVCTICKPSLVPVFRARGDFCEEHGLPESICPTCHPEAEGRPSQAVGGSDGPADGTRVRLASPQLAARTGISVVEAVAAPDYREILATARVTYDPSHVARINPRSPGVVRAIHADIGDQVAPGDELVAIASAEVAAAGTRVSAARSALEVAEANLERTEQLDGVVSERARLHARQQRDEARADLASLRSSLGVVGRTRGAEYSLSSPIAGVVTRRLATIGTYVEGGTVLFEIADASRVWIEVQIPEDEVEGVEAGHPVAVTMGALGERQFQGTLQYLAPEIDPHTRTALGRIPLDNPDGSLRAHMFGEARIQVPRPEPAVTVPRGAVQRARGTSLVFVREAAELFEARRVEVIDRPGDPAHVEVRGRIAPGEEVVVEGAFLLRTETISDSIGAGCCGGEE